MDGGGWGWTGWIGVDDTSFDCTMLCVLMGAGA
jgi:hypothetical protein